MKECELADVCQQVGLMVFLFSKRDWLATINIGNLKLDFLSQEYCSKRKRYLHWTSLVETFFLLKFLFTSAVFVES